MNRGDATPRSIVKALIHGQIPERPLFIPLIFTLAARLEDLALSTFLANPTKLANALTALHHRLRTDGVVGYFDPTLEAEALGCRLDWQAAPPAIAARPAADLSSRLQLSPPALAELGRIPVALEVVRRLRVTLRDEPAILVGLTGPIQLGQYLVGADFVRRLADGDSAAQFMVEELAGLTLHLAQALCQAGADLIWVGETAPPPAVFELWEMSLSGVWNVIRFHEALPLLSMGQASLPTSPEGAPVLCLPAELLETAPLPHDPFGLALATSGAPPMHLKSLTRSGRCVLVTTAGEIGYHGKGRPTESDIQGLEQTVSALRSVL